jgi:hypothetical protein
MNIVDNISGAVQVGCNILFSPLLRKLYNRWGVSDLELQQTLPGDDLVPKSMLGYTRAVTIRATPLQIWPWVAQIGQGRGGLYSYDGLENLVGCQIRSSDQILPEHQDPKVGDLIRLGKPGYPCFRIVSLESCRSLVLLSADPKTEQSSVYSEGQAKGYSIATWQFFLQPIDKQETRLIVRQRLAYSPDMAWIWRMTEPVAFVMERKMLRGLKKRAEQR